MTPFGLPDDDETGNDRKTAEEEERDADVAVSGSKPARERDADGANGTERELEEDGRERGVAKS